MTFIIRAACQIIHSSFQMTIRSKELVTIIIIIIIIDHHHHCHFHNNHHQGEGTRRCGPSTVVE